MATVPKRSAPLARCLPLNALALGFSLAHVLVDWHIGLFGASTPDLSGTQAALVGLVCALYAWWAVALAAAQGTRSGLLALAVLSGGWSVLGNGLPLFLCLPPCDDAFPYQDLAHAGNLLFGAWAAYESWRAAWPVERPRDRREWSLSSVALGLIVVLFAVQTALDSL